MTGQMCWLSAFGSEYKILHLRLQSHQLWQPYTALSHLAVADYDIPGSSKGMATYHVLSQAGWQLVATKDARRAISAPPQQDVA
jgi:hypothetical protein